MPRASRAGSTVPFKQRYCWSTISRTDWLMRLELDCAAASGRRPILRYAGRHLLLQPADPDHEEFVEIRSENGQELDAVPKAAPRRPGLPPGRGD